MNTTRVIEKQTRRANPHVNQARTGVIYLRMTRSLVLLVTQSFLDKIIGETRCR
jgi:hypothetical protein